MTEEKTKPKSGPEEPSMEDILSSIRRILSEDGGESADEQREESLLEEKSDTMTDSDTGIELAEGMSELPEPEIDAGSVADLAADRSNPVSPARDNVLQLTPEMRVVPGDRVVSSSTAVASTDVLSQLAKAILNHRDVAVGARTVTLEGMVREMLRPLLKEWLDRNLPYLIERLVKREIDLMINRAERLED